MAGKFDKGANNGKKLLEGEIIRKKGDGGVHVR